MLMLARKGMTIPNKCDKRPDAFPFGNEYPILPRARGSSSSGRVVPPWRNGRRARLKSNSKTFENQKILANTSVSSHIFRQKC